MCGCVLPEREGMNRESAALRLPPGICRESLAFGPLPGSKMRMRKHTQKRVSADFASVKGRRMEVGKRD